MAWRQLWAVLLSSLLVCIAGCSARSGGAKASYARAPGGPMDAVTTADTGGGGEAEVMMEADDAEPMEPEPVAAAPMRERVSSEAAGAAPPRQAPGPVNRPEPPKARNTTPTESPTGGEQTGTKPAVASQLLVYTADLRIRVREVEKAVEAVEKLAKARGGYLVVREDNRITIRVPSKKFDSVLNEVADLGDLVHRNVTVEDVTDLYFDMQTRMKNLEVVKQRLEELLAKAKTVEESLAVQRQLERVTTELERLKGKLKLLAELVMFSTINVAFEPMQSEHLDRTVRLPFPWMNQLGLGSLMQL